MIEVTAVRDRLASGAFDSICEVADSINKASSSVYFVVDDPDTVKDLFDYTGNPNIVYELTEKHGAEVVCIFHFGNTKHTQAIIDSIGSKHAIWGLPGYGVSGEDWEEIKDVLSGNQS